MNDERGLLQLEDLDFIEAAYLLALGRPADPQGLAGYLDRLRVGVPKLQVLEELQLSDEGQLFAARRSAELALTTPARKVAYLLGLDDDGTFVHRSCFELTGRNATAAEAEAALRALAEGVARIDVLRQIRRSPTVPGHRSAIEDLHRLDLTATQEAGILNSSLQDMLVTSDEAFLHMAYWRLLGREADRSGLTTYLNLLRLGMPRLVVLRLLSESGEGRECGAHVEGLTEALRGVSYVRHKVAVKVRRALARERSGSPNTTAYALPAAAPLAGPDADRTGPSGALVAQAGLAALRSKLRPGPALERLDAPPTALQRRAAGDLRLKAPPPNAQQLVEPPAVLEQVCLARFVGAYAYGWSFKGSASHPCGLTFGGQDLGHLLLDQARPDLQTAHALESDQLGFATLLGGLLQFSALAAGCHSVQLELVGSPASRRDFSLLPHLTEALAFSPLRSFGRLPEGRGAGRLLSLELGAANEFSLLYEAGKSNDVLPKLLSLDVYQESAPGKLKVLARFALTMSGQISMLDFRLLSRRAPVLLVLSDAMRNIMLAECVPLPEMHAAKQRALIEYHSVLTGGQPAFDVAAKIARGHLDAVIRRRLSPSHPVSGPTRETTCVLLYSRDHYDFLGDAELTSLQTLSERVALLRSDGTVQTHDGERSNLRAYLSSGVAEYVLFVEIRTSPRPDFWAALEQNRFRIHNDARLLHWQSIWLRGMARPYVAKPGLLLHPEFSTHALMPLQSALVRADEVLNALGADSTQFRSGSLKLERAFAKLGADAAVNIPVVLDATVWPVPPRAAARMFAEHAPLPELRKLHGSPVPRPGMSVIVNFRNSVGPTVACLDSLRTQSYGGPIEIVLVNNLSSAASVAAVTSRACELFGADAVRLIDYPREFNHSAQCNLAAMAAQHELLLMLSNDSILLTEDALSVAAGVAMVPWVATTGFRIVGGAGAKSKLQSLGLAAARRQFLLQGGSPLSTHQPPAFLCDFTQETLGNTFAAAVVRRELFLEFGGLDEEAFPTNYNDVDFCCRTLQQGYRHVSIGAAVVEHVGRGSRESDLDLPIDQRMVERCPALSVLSRVGVYQL